MKDRERQGSYSFKKGIADAGDSVNELRGDQPYEVKVKTEKITVSR